jgi:Fe-S cluster assembly protein SufD
MIVKTETAPFLEAFRARSRSAEPAWLTAHREASLARFGELGYPSRREEAWRFTDLRPLQRTTWGVHGGYHPATALLRHEFTEPTHRLVLMHGRFAPALSRIGRLPSGAWLASTEQTLAERSDLLAEAIETSDTLGNQPFASLNAALFEGGFVLALEPGVVLERPVELVHLGGEGSRPNALHVLRNLIRLGARSAATVIETYAGEGSYWTNGVTAVHLAENATLTHARLQDEPRDAINFAMTRARLAKGARLDSFALTTGARLSRHDIIARMEGEGARLALNGAYLLRGEQEATTAIVVDHAAPGGTTREVWKGVVDERAHGVFLGTIQVRPHAQKTDAHQLNKNLLLSRRAHVDTKPELEILADDVKCSHGATVGDLDESALFYLRARGIAEPEARRMLIEAFAADALDEVENVALRRYLAEHVQAWLDPERP